MNSEIRILLLEDDAELLVVIRETLEEEGYQVLAAQSGEDALGLSYQQEFDLLVTDVRLPGIDGLDTLLRVRELQPEVRGIVMTGYASEDDTIRALRLGVGEYLKKPFTLQQLLEVVHILSLQIGQQRVDRQQQSAQEQLLDWALEQHLGNSGEAESHLRARVCLQSWCERAGLEQESCQSARLSLALRFVDSESLPSFVRICIPKRVQALQLAAQGLEHALVETALAEAAGKPLPGLLPKGLLDPNPENHTNKQDRHILTLALGLEQSGQHHQAVLAYGRLLQAGKASREGLLAAKQLMGLALRFGRKAEVSEYAQRMIGIARELGPLSLCAALVDCVPNLKWAGLTDVKDLLEEGRQLARLLGQDGRDALLEMVAVWCEAGRQLEAGLLARLQALGAEDLQNASHWLLPFLLEQDRSFDWPRWLVRWPGGQPGLLLRHLQAGTFSTEARRRLAQLPLPEPVQTVLAGDVDDLVRRNLSQARGASSGLPAMSLRSLGFLELHFGDERLPEENFKKNQKARQILVYLALERAKPIHEEVLVEHFWPSDAGAGKQNLYSIRSIWKKTLVSRHLPAGFEVVVRTAAGLMVNPDLDWWHDSEELKRTLAEAERYWKEDNLQQAREGMRRAVSLYRGPFLDGCYLDWSITLAQQLEDQVVSAHLRLAELALRQPAERGREALEDCLRVLELDACCQDAYRMAMEAQLALAQPVEAIRLFERCRKVMLRELQAEPGIPLLELYHRARMLL